MPPKSGRPKKSAELDAFMATEEGTKLFTSLASCAEGLRGLSEFIHHVLPNYLAPASTSEPHEGDEKSKRRAKRDPEMPKRPAAAYLLFLNDVRRDITREHPDWQMKEVTAEGARRWKLATDAEKLPFEQQAEVLRRDYAHASRAYREKKGLPIQTSANAKKYRAEAEAVVSNGAEPGQDDNSGESDATSSGSGSEDESSEDEQKFPVQAPAPAQVKGGKQKAPEPAKSPKPAAPAPAPASAKKQVVSTPSKPAKNGGKRKADEEAAPPPSGSVVVKKNKKTPSDSKSSRNQLPSSGEPAVKRKVGRPRKEKVA